MNHFLEFQNLHSNRVGNQNLCEEYYQDLLLDRGMEDMIKGSSCS